MPATGMDGETQGPPPRRRGPRAGELSPVRVLRRGLLACAGSFPSLLLLVVLVYSPLLLYKGVELSGERPFLERTTTWGELIARLLLESLATAAVIYTVFQRLRGERAPLRESLRTVLARILPVFGAALLQVGVVAVTALAAGLLASIHPAAGFLALFFVAYAYCMLWMTIPAVIVERAGPFSALKRSVVLTDGNKARIFLVLLVLWAARLGAAWLIGRETSGDTGVVLDLAATLLLGMVEATMNAVAYHELRRAREGVSLDDLVKVFA